MDTYFAAPEKTDENTLNAEIAAVGRNPIISGLLFSISGLLAVLNRHRQIIAMNDTFLKMIGVDDPAQALGLRPGDVLKCIHATDKPAGCGTTRFCSTCGAAVAIVSSIEHDMPFERLCALSANRGGDLVDIVLRVRSQPINIDHSKYLLLFVQDITQQEQRAALERTFYHDISNMVNILVQASERLTATFPSEMSTMIQETTWRLSKEVTIQRSLSEHSAGSYKPMWDSYPTQKIVNELHLFFANHPAATGKRVLFPKTVPAHPMTTDLCLLLRVLSNMIINALEATETGGSVTIWIEDGPNSLTFCVWNAQYISPRIADRIFQRNFSTKEQPGRGIGTYSMKLFGEKILGGQVTFTSSEGDGTVFKFIHPVS